MPKLKCIGGVCDGELADVHDGYSIHDQVRVPIKLELKIDTPYYSYKICVLQGKHISGETNKLYYLIPYNWHEWEAIQHLFRCYQPYG